MADPISFLDLRFNPLTLTEATDWIASCDAESDFGYVVTPNVDHMVRLSEAPADIVAAYDAASLVLCDSRILARLARSVGVVLPVVPGSDLVSCLFSDVLEPNDRICVIGGDAADIAALRALYPALDILHHDAPRGLRTNPASRTAAARFAIAAKARLTLLAVGSPQQELIAHEIARDGAARGIALCIGAAVEFITGTQTRAPLAIQNAGLEWGWRLALSPRRLARRYLIDGPRIFALVRKWHHRRTRS